VRHDNVIIAPPLAMYAYVVRIRNLGKQIASQRLEPPPISGKYAGTGDEKQGRGGNGSQTPSTTSSNSAVKESRPVVGRKASMSKPAAASYQTACFLIQ